MRPKSVALVGFMGAGKTTVGQRVAKLLGFTFVDTDALVEAAAQSRVADIFAEYGEERFRQLEREAIAQVADEPSLVIATGGGAFVDETTRRRLLSTTVVIYLSVPFDLLWPRLVAEGGRPLIDRDDGQRVARELFERREPIYRMAHATVDASRSKDEVCSDVVEVYRGRR